MSTNRTPHPTRLALVTNEYARGPVDQIELVIGDLHLRCDIVSERQVQLAERLARDFGVDLTDMRRASAPHHVCDGHSEIAPGVYQVCLACTDQIAARAAENQQ